MRFSVRWPDVCPGEERCILRKSAFYGCDVTKKRILDAIPHAKTHSAVIPHFKSDQKVHSHGLELPELFTHQQHSPTGCPRSPYAVRPYLASRLASSNLSFLRPENGPDAIRSSSRRRSIWAPCPQST